MKPTSTYYDRVRGAAESISERLDAAHASVAIVLGSGLAGAASILEQARSVPYVSIPGFPEPTVAGHPGRLACGTVAGRKTLIFCGRVHGYEGYAPSEVGFGIRLAATLGVGTIIVTNVSGGVDPALKVGEIVAITDHLNLTGQSPLTGTNDERFGPRFVDMTDTYAPELRRVAMEAARSAGLGTLREATYAGMAGPQYETPAEVRMLRLLGAGLVGMSTVLEVIAARHAGMKILGLSLVANPAAGVEPAPLRHEDVTDAAAAGTKKMAALLAAIIAKLEL